MIPRLKPRIEGVREKGVSLRATFVMMMVLSLGITAVLLFVSYRSIRSFREMSQATDNYIEMSDAAQVLMDASDYLTEEAQCYAVMGERRHLDNYLNEADTVRRREKAVETLEKRMPDSGAQRELKEALEESRKLMGREYYAMRLMMHAVGDENVPEALRAVTLSPEDLAMTPAEQKTRAALMLHDDSYYVQKNEIREHLALCLSDLKTGTHGTQGETENRMHRVLTVMVVFIVLQSLVLLLLLWLTTSLGINPLMQAVERIKMDKNLPIIGASEFRYLAGTYNKMYAAYKKSISHLSFQASHDELTGVYNRAGYDLIVQGVDLENTAFLLVDADRFKNVNDSFGHEAGDRMIRKIAEVLKTNFRQDDYICRLGGDEFLVLMVHVGDKTRSLIEKKVETINQELSSDRDGLPPMSVSVGVSMGSAHKDAKRRLEEADQAMYLVKKQGRHGCCFYQPERAECG